MPVLSVSKGICNVNAPLRVVMHTLNSFSMKHCQFYLALYLKRKGDLFLSGWSSQTAAIIKCAKCPYAIPSQSRKTQEQFTLRMMELF